MSNWTYAQIPLHERAYPGVTDTVLRKHIQPLLAAHIAQGRIQDFHFLRYGSPAYHLRLRVRGTAQRAADRFWQALTDRLAPMPIIPTHYDPEIEKYGGPDGIALAEKSFTASSVLALAAIMQRIEPAMRAALAAEVLRGQLHLIAPGDHNVQRKCLSDFRDIWARHAAAPATLPHHRAECHSPAVQAALKTWQEHSIRVAQVLMGLEQSARLSTSRATFHLNMAHLFANRVGLGPAMEWAMCNKLLQEDYEGADVH